MCAQRVYLIPQEQQRVINSPPTLREILERFPITQRDAAEHILQTIQNDLHLNDDGQVLYNDATDSNVPGSYVWELLDWYLLKPVVGAKSKKPPDFPLFQKLLEQHGIISNSSSKTESLQTRSIDSKSLHFPKSWIRLYNK